jgi:hypothetical protein
MPLTSIASISDETLLVFPRGPPILGFAPTVVAAALDLASVSEGGIIADENNKLSSALDGFELVLAAATALVRARSARPALLDAYDDAADRLIEGLRDNGIPEQELQNVHKAISRLRLAFEETPPGR